METLCWWSFNNKGFKMLQWRKYFIYKHKFNLLLILQVQQYQQGRIVAHLVGIILYRWTLLGGYWAAGIGNRNAN